VEAEGTFEMTVPRNPMIMMTHAWETKGSWPEKMTSA
jgi:hypothetical protein